MQQFFTPNMIMLIARLLGLGFAIPFHEVAHAWVSDKLGDPTARQMGRLSLNPIKHVDFLGLLSMMIIGVGWAKPVPVNPAYYKNRKVGMAVTAVAGPLSNLVLAFVALVFRRLAINFFFMANPAALFASSSQFPFWLSVVLLVLQYFALINITLALFNMLPIPPLDGSRIFGLVLPERAYFAIQKVERYIMVVLLAVIFLLPRLTGISPLNWLLGDAVDAVMQGLDWATSWVDVVYLHWVLR